jgi:hypothetical protein
LEPVKSVKRLGSTLASTMALLCNPGNLSGRRRLLLCVFRYNPGLAQGDIPQGLVMVAHIGVFGYNCPEALQGGLCSFILKIKVCHVKFVAGQFFKAI